MTSSAMPQPGTLGEEIPDFGGNAFYAGHQPCRIRATDRFRNLYLIGNADINSIKPFFRNVKYFCEKNRFFANNTKIRDPAYSFLHDLYIMHFLFRKNTKY